MPNNTMPVAIRRVDLVILFFVVVVFSFGQSSLFLLYRGPDIHNLGLATAGIFHGETHWRTYQNRLLGPALVLLSQKFLCIVGRSCDYDVGLRFYYFFATGIVNLIFVFLAVHIRRDVVFGFICLIAFIGFQILMWTYWYYPWDPVEVSLFSILLLMDIKKKRPMIFFYTLFLFWVFNKETVVFIPLWLLLTRGVVPSSWRSLQGWWALNKKIAAHAAGMLIAAAVIIKTLRDQMFVRSVLPGVGVDEGHMRFGDFYQLPTNIHIIKNELAKIMYFNIDAGGYGSLYAVTLTGLFLYAAWRFRQSRRLLPPLALRIFIFAALYFGFIVVAGIMIETRVYLPLAPMALALYLVMNGDTRWKPVENS